MSHSQYTILNGWLLCELISMLFLCCCVHSFISFLVWVFNSIVSSYHLRANCARVLFCTHIFDTIHNYLHYAAAFYFKTYVKLCYTRPRRHMYVDQLVTLYYIFMCMLRKTTVTRTISNDSVKKNHKNSTENM